MEVNGRVVTLFKLPRDRPGQGERAIERSLWIAADSRRDHIQLVVPGIFEIVRHYAGIRSGTTGMASSAYNASEDDFGRKVYVCLNLDCPREGEAVGKTRLPVFDYELSEVPLRDKPMRICDECGKEMALCDSGGLGA